jgi:hypothetical protein
MFDTGFVRFERTILVPPAVVVAVYVSVAFLH